MKTSEQSGGRKKIIFAAVFLLVNLLAIGFLGHRESAAVNSALSARAQNTQQQFEAVMGDYERSFRLFSQMMAREIARDPNPDVLWDYLKSIDRPLLDIEGETFDGLYMYYLGRYLYSWDTPYSVYAETGYIATERPWYQAAVQGRGEIVFTAPYMSYANHYILTTIAQLQPDGETVFAYDIKMGDIQSLVSLSGQFDNEQTMIFDSNGTVIGSTDEAYLGGNLFAPLADTAAVAADAQAELAALSPDDQGEIAKAQDKLDAATAFYAFRQGFDPGLAQLRGAEGKAAVVNIGGASHFGLLLQEGDFNILLLVPVLSMLQATTDIWLVPFLIMELLLIYLLGRVSKEQKNRELKSAYIELGQIQKRLEIALSAAQKAAAIDDLTGMMNFKSFKRGVTDLLDAMDEEDSGILIMMDGDHFKRVNDTYGHSVGDEVIKLSAQMIIGRIRTVDLASRLHGDEFAIFVSDTANYTTAEKIVTDINKSIAKEAQKRNIPAITLSGGAIIARHGDNYAALAKAADAALYKAKENHDGGFAHSGHSPVTSE